MELFIFREPVNAWTHGAWMLLCIPAGIFLQLRARSLLKRVGFAVFTVSLIACFLGSCLYHAVHARSSIDLCARVDYIGIFLLIAGTMTPVMLIILDGWWRAATLFVTWSMAITGIVIRVLNLPLPDEVSTGLYIMMGWTSLLCYCELARRLSHRAMRPVWIGGVIYSLGAVLNELHWPNLWPGNLGSHEVFHLFVMAASLCHFCFMVRVVAPFESPLLEPAEPAPSFQLVPEQATA